MAQLPIPELVTHAQRVCRLYRRALRNIKSWHPDITVVRYESVVLRDRFDKNKDIKDLRLAKHLLIEGEKELEADLHPQQIMMAESADGGPAYNRNFPLPDYILDHWDPMEKAAYPKYFALREQRKKEYVDFFYKNYMPDEKLPKP